MKLSPLLILLSLTCTAQLKTISINGMISLSEKRDTSEFRIDPASTESFLIKRNDKYVYAGIRNYSIAATNVILAKDDKLVVIHLSGCTGRAVYIDHGDSLQVERPIQNVTEHPEAWDVIGVYASEVGLKKKKLLSDQKKEMDTCMKREGYTGSTIDLGSSREAEILIDRKVFAGFSLLLQNTESYTENNTTLRRPAVHPPAGYSGTIDALRKFLAAEQGTVIKDDFNLSAWIKL